MPRLLLTLLFPCLLWGCKDYDGGAIEIAWVIRGTDQHAYECSSTALGENRIDKIRLIIRGAEGEYKDQDICLLGQVKDCTFSCDATFGSGTHRGVTSFTIPEGNWYIGIVPLDSNGAAIPSERIQTPDPVVKSISQGDLTFMGVWQIVVNLQK